MGRTLLPAAFDSDFSETAHRTKSNSKAGDKLALSEAEGKLRSTHALQSLMPGFLHLLSLRQTDLSFRAFWLQEQRRLKLICRIVRIFEAEVDLAES